jgi:radical SAM-linked protein
MRRFRIGFTKGDEVRYVSHLDLMRTWERILRRARLRVAHSQGFNPRPRLVFAAPLPVAVTSDAELLDVVLDDELSVSEFVDRVGTALCPGVRLLHVEELPMEAPAVMASVLSSDYQVDVTPGNMEPLVAEFLARTTVPYNRTRKGQTKQADMRSSVLGLWVESTGRLGMRLRLDIEGAAVRPEEVVAAMGGSLEVKRVHRTALQLKESAVAA